MLNLHLPISVLFVKLFQIFGHYVLAFFTTLPKPLTLKHRFRLNVKGREYKGKKVCVIEVDREINEEKKVRESKVCFRIYHYTYRLL